MVALSKKHQSVSGGSPCSRQRSPRLLALAVGVSFAGGILAASRTPAAPGNPTYKNPNARVKVRLEDLLSRMTLEQKVAQMHKALERISFSAGESKTVTFRLTPETFRMWNIAMQRVVEPGAFEVMVGPNSVDLKTTVLHIGD